jgi:hypothetical protein
MLPTAGLIAVIHSVVIGFTLWILGVPLATKGWVAALTSAVLTSAVLTSRRRGKDCG